MTLVEAAQCLKMGKSTLDYLVRKGKVAALEMGRTWRFDAEELHEWLKVGKSALLEERRL